MSVYSFNRNINDNRCLVKWETNIFHSILTLFRRLSFNEWLITTYNAANKHSLLDSS